MKHDLNGSQVKSDLTAWTDVYKRLNNDVLPSLATREVLVRYLKTQFLVQNGTALNKPEIAYRVAGLLAARGIKHMPKDDPICKVLELAAQVELPIQYHAKTDTWDQLVKSVNQL